MHWVRTEQKFNPIIVFCKRRKKYCLFRAFHVVILHGMLCTNNITKPKRCLYNPRDVKPCFVPTFPLLCIGYMMTQCRENSFSHHLAAEAIGPSGSRPGADKER